MGILNFIFPKHCVSCKKLGEYICADCFALISFNPYEICLVCNRGSIDGLTHPFCKTRYSIDGAFTSISYKGVVKKLIYQFKYKPFVSDMQKALVELFYEGLIQKEQFIKTIEQPASPSLAESRRAQGGFSNEAMVLVPIPLHKSKLQKRGYNQAELLSFGLSKRFNIRTVDILMRIKNTPSQVGLERKKRIENISNAFSIVPNILISPPRLARSLASLRSGSGEAGQYPNILLVDDVLTTGSTLLEAARVLKRNGVKKVWGIALARD